MPGYGYSVGFSRRWGRAIGVSEILLTWRAGATGGVVADDVDSALPVIVADIVAAGAATIELLADPDDKFDLVDNGNGTAELRINAAVAYATKPTHGFTIKATLNGESVYYAGEVALYAVVVGTAPSSITFSPAALAVGNKITDNEDSALPLAIGTLTANGTHPITLAITADPDSKFALVDNGNGTAALQIDQAINAGTDTSHSVTVQATNASGSTSQSFTFTIEAPTNTSGLDQGDGAVVGSPSFSESVTAKNSGGGLRLRGKHSAEAKFLFNIGAPHPVAGQAYTLKYDPDFSALTLQGKKAFVGFGFKDTSQASSPYHLVGLRGDGATGLKTYQIYGSNFSTGTATKVDGGAALHGTQAGPNWARLIIAADGSTYDFYTSTDGVDFDLEYTGQTPTPMANADADVAQFGIAGFFEDDDKGAFAVDIQVWVSATTIGVPVNLVAPSIAAV
jgi:hypothetical protein